MERTGVYLVLSSLRWAGDSLNRKEAVAQLWSRNWMGEAVSGLRLAMRRNLPKGKGAARWGQLRIKFYDRFKFPASRGPLKPWLLVQAGTIKICSKSYR